MTLPRLQHILIHATAPPGTIAWLEGRGVRYASRRVGAQPLSRVVLSGPHGVKVESNPEGDRPMLPARRPH